MLLALAIAKETGESSWALEQNMFIFHVNISKRYFHVSVPEISVYVVKTYSKQVQEDKIFYLFQPLRSIHSIKCFTIDFPTTL